MLEINDVVLYCIVLYYGDTICHPRSGYVTIKLHGTSTADATIMRYFKTELFSRFLPSPYAGHGKALVVHAKVAR